MSIGTRHRARLRIAPFIILCLASTGCAASAPAARPDRLAGASRICRGTMGLNPANAPHQQCVDSLLQNVSALDWLSPLANDRLTNPKGSNAPPAGDTQAACAQFGLRPDSEAFATCVSNLDETIFEATHPLPG
jgi:hypothetical protein